MLKLSPNLILALLYWFTIVEPASPGIEPVTYMMFVMYPLGIYMERVALPMMREDLGWSSDS